MRSLRHLFQAIESLRTLAAVDAEWKVTAGADHRQLKPFLRPRPELATSFPRTGHALPYTVVQHGPDDWVGVCPETGDVVPLSRRQLVVYELDQERLATQVSKALGLEDARPLASKELRLFSLGILRTPCVSRSVEAFFAIPSGTRCVADCVAWLASRGVGAYLLATPTGRFVPGELAVRVRSQGSAFLSLADSLQADGDGRWHVVDGAMRSAFSAGHEGEEPLLGERARAVLVALHELQAFDGDSRKSTAEVAARALGPGADANAVKAVIAELHQRRLVDTKTGRGGGCWLTDSGKRRAQKLA